MASKKVQNTPVVRKSNALARARWNPDSIWEPRLVALVASKIQAFDADFQIYEIPIVELIGKNPGGRDYKEIEHAVDKAMGRIITIRISTGWTKYTLFCKCEFDSKQGILKVGFHPDLKEHYLSLKQYMQFELTEFMILTSVYSQRLFEILKSWDDKYEVIINLSDLHTDLGTPQSMKINFAEFKRRVLDKAHKDINEHTSLKFEWEPIKIGRAIKKIRFIFIKQQPKKLDCSPQAKALVRQALGVASPEEAEKQQKSIEHRLFQQFIMRFNDKARIGECWELWQRLYAAGNAPMAHDVPDNSGLGLYEFLVQWEKEQN